MVKTLRIKGCDNYETMQNFGLKSIPGLDVCVLGALEFLSDQKLPKINIGKNLRLLVIGSGNALVTGKIIFGKHDATFASESDYQEKFGLAKYDLVVLISASGGKHAIDIAKFAKARKKRTILLTNNSEAKAAKFVNKVLVFPRQREPYTYNTSTYLSMILAMTGESPKQIYDYIKRFDKKIPNNFAKYDAFYFMLPSKYDAARELFVTKFDELFGPMLMGKVFTDEQTKHAKTVVPYSKELFVSFGIKNDSYGKNRFDVKLPEGSSFGMLMMVGYYLIGKIQGRKEPYFKKNIVRYTKEASKLFGQEIKPIVE